MPAKTIPSNRESWSNNRQTLVVGTRGSALAQWQTGTVVNALKRLYPELEIQVRTIKTWGDKDQARALGEFGGLGIFTKEIEQALVGREIDLAVHSLKDLPTTSSPDLAIYAITERADPRDCVVSRHNLGLKDLPPGSRVGTSSTRRAAQVRLIRPDLNLLPLRGNVDTRLRKAQTDEYDAIILAAAGLIRLGRESEITEYLDLEFFLPDPGQGALAIQGRAGDPALTALVSPLNHPETSAAVTAERALLRALGGGCRMPLGAYAQVVEGGLRLHGVVAAPDGSRAIRDQIFGSVDDAEHLGIRLSEQLLLPGGKELLDLTLLFGKRIMITRAREQALDFARKIKLYGGIPVEFPTLQFEPMTDRSELDKALGQLDHFDWVVFTSANGVRAVQEQLASVRQSRDGTKPFKLAAIGPATARELESLGLSVDFVPTQYLGTQIAVELPIHPGERVLLLRADIASEDLAAGLRARGALVTDLDAYRTLAAPVTAVNLDQVDAVTFTSASTVRNWLLMVGEEGRKALKHIAVFCIGPVTAHAARSLNLRVDAVAEEHTEDGLLKMMIQYYQGNHSNA